MPPDLEDRRDRLAETLGELIGASTQVGDDGTAVVRLGGRILLQEDAIEQVAFDPVRAGTPTVGGRAVEPNEFGGRIGGLLEVRDEDLRETIARLDEFAARLAEDVNAIHQQGVDARGNPAGAFFVFSGSLAGNEKAAARLEVAPALVRDAAGVAAGTAAAPGENSIALDIAALRNEDGGAPGMLRSLVVDLAARSREAQDLLEGQQVVVDSFRAQRESVSGVSLDEEAARLLQFQRSYEASARILAAADEMVRTILSL